jgi:Domain of unknown function (DUF4398)
MGIRDCKPCIFAFALVTASCASVPPPTTEMALGKDAIADAQHAGATEHSPVELHLAESKLASARAAMAHDQNERARRLAEEAEVDAKLTEAKARTAKAKAAVAELHEGIRTLRNELDHASN